MLFVAPKWLLMNCGDTQVPKCHLVCVYANVFVCIYSVLPRYIILFLDMCLRTRFVSEKAENNKKRTVNHSQPISRPVRAEQFVEKDRQTANVRGLTYIYIHINIASIYALHKAKLNGSLLCICSINMVYMSIILIICIYILLYKLKTATKLRTIRMCLCIYATTKSREK